MKQIESIAVPMPNQEKPMIIYGMGVDTQYAVRERSKEFGGILLSGLSSGLDFTKRYLGALGTNIATEARTGVFDAIHGTDFRTQRHMEIENRKRARFAGSIGLEYTDPCAKHRK